MSKAISNLKVIRQNLLKATEGLSFEMLTKVPTGFNNNILWNACHMLTTQQILVYKLSGLPFRIENEFVERYKKGTAPKNEIQAENDWLYFKEQCIPTLDQLGKDLNANIFMDFQVYTTSFGLTLSNIEDAIHFNQLHESMHLGFVLAMKHTL